MTNFDFLKKDSQFSSFSDIAILAEQLIDVDINTCVLTCRRAMEAGVKWMYSVDDDLHLPYQDQLATLISTDEFKDIVPKDILTKLHFIRKNGNEAAHSSRKITREMASLCLRNLFEFFNFLSCSYSDDCKPAEYNEALEKNTGFVLVPSSEELKEGSVSLPELITENASKRKVLTVKRKEQAKKYVVKALDVSEFETRRLYIDTMLIDAGWTKNKDWIEELELKGMPNTSGVGYADYVLFGDDGLPLAVIEAKKTSVDVAKGRQQAKLYADLLERKYHRRPIIFLSNGFDTRIWDDKYYPERSVASIYSKRDLEKLFNLRLTRVPLKNAVVNDSIAGRYYQKGAIKAVCERFDRDNKRKALLVMATGSGKTRTVIGLVDVLMQCGWVKHTLFLADRTSLVLQAKRAFVNLLPDISVTNLCEDKENYNAHVVFSTYQTMYGCIDNVRDESGKLFSVGHFDLVVVDEAHRSIYNKYKEIFDYFDAPLVGLTATPKDEIDRNTYELFELESGVPTYGYELAQAVSDGFLVPFIQIEANLKFIEEGINYEDLPPEEKEIYENTFEQEDGSWPSLIDPGAINQWVFNEDTIRKVLNTLMTKGLHVDYGTKVGKTIIFAANHRHAERIKEIFDKEYPHLKNQAAVIDNQINYAQTLIDDFSISEKLPQIAISVDMLDTGIDVPEVLNLVFFKKVFSKSKFWQMIGRGTRTCTALLDDGVDKKEFYIFDFCDNFKFFSINEGKESNRIDTLQSALFMLKASIALELQDLRFSSDEFIDVRKQMVSDMVDQVKKLDQKRFDIRQHLKYVVKYSKPENYAILSFLTDIQDLENHIAPFVLPLDEDVSALRFDALLFQMEISVLENKAKNRAKGDLMKKARGLLKCGSIPEVRAQSQLITDLLNESYIDSLDFFGLENVRKALRNLIKFIPKTDGSIYDTNFTDTMVIISEEQGDLGSGDLKNYRDKIEYYIKKHLNDDDLIQRINNNLPLSEQDLDKLNQTIVNGVGLESGDVKNFAGKPLNVFIREIVGLSKESLNKAFSGFVSAYNLDSRQIYFVNQIIAYFEKNGFLEDKSVLQDTPFTDQGSLSDVFTDMKMWHDLMTIVDGLNLA